MAKIVTFREELPTDFKVEKGVPHIKKSRSLRYPFGSMSIGDSFSLGDIMTAHRARAAASVYGKRHNMKFSICREDGTTEYRCWRIK